MGQVMQVFSVPCWWVGWRLWRVGCISQDTYLLYNIKHNLARSCFQLWPSKSAPRMTKFREKTVSASASPVFFLEILSPSSPILSQNWKHDLARSCFILEFSREKDYWIFFWIEYSWKNWYWIIIRIELNCEMNEWIKFWIDICHFWWKAPFFVYFGHFLGNFWAIIPFDQN